MTKLEKREFILTLSDVFVAVAVAVAVVDAEAPSFIGYGQPSHQEFSTRSFLDSTMSCDVTERYSPSSLARSLPDFTRTTDQERTPRVIHGNRGLFCLSMRDR